MPNGLLPFNMWPVRRWLAIGNSLMRAGRAYHETCNYQAPTTAAKQVPETELDIKMAVSGMEECQIVRKMMHKSVPFATLTWAPTSNNYEVTTELAEPGLPTRGLFSTTVKLEQAGRPVSPTSGGEWQGGHLRQQEGGRRPMEKSGMRDPASTSYKGRTECLRSTARYMSLLAWTSPTGSGVATFYYSMRQAMPGGKAINPGQPLQLPRLGADPCPRPTGDKTLFCQHPTGRRGQI